MAFPTKNVMCFFSQFGVGLCIPSCLTKFIIRHREHKTKRNVYRWHLYRPDTIQIRRHRFNHSAADILRYNCAYPFHLEDRDSRRLCLPCPLYCLYTTSFFDAVSFSCIDFPVSGKPIWLCRNIFVTRMLENSFFPPLLYTELHSSLALGGGGGKSEASLGRPMPPPPPRHLLNLTPWTRQSTFRLRQDI